MQTDAVLDPRSEFDLAKEMLAGHLSYATGAYQICRLRSRIGGIGDRDEDFVVFLAIESETDHRPLQAQRHFWSDRALKELEPELERTQNWAASFAEGACQRLISRLSQG